MPRRRAILQMLLIGVPAGIATGGVAYFIPWLPAQASREAEAIDGVYWFVAIICGLIFAVVAGVTVYSAWKFRAAPDDTEDGSPIHGHTGLEITWTVIPTILVTAMSIYSGVVLTDIERLPDDHRVIKVTAQQFAWRFEYGDEKLTTGELVLPIDETVELQLTAEDVIHSFWVPEWRVKKDAVPGIVTDIVVTPTKEGRFPVVCTELCGLGHAAMRARAVVVSPDEFEQWVADQKRAAAAGAAVQGKQLFANECGSCHALADAGTTGETGPNLDNVLAGKDAEYVREQIVNPDSKITPGFQPGVMPQDFEERLAEPQLDSLVEYLLTAAGKR
jgi:cytochrome c oxidase subunit II